MSSRILRRDQGDQAALIRWKPLPVGEGGAETYPLAESPTSHPHDPPTPPPPPPGPPLEDYLKLEAHLRALEQALPDRERRAHQKGREEGEAAAAAKWEPALENAARSLSAVASLRARLRREAEQDVIRLASAMARRILRRELSIDPEAISGLLKTAFERLEMREASRIRIRPEDRETIAACLARIGGPSRVEIIPDSTLERGAFLLESDRGQLDASVETQLDEIERGFADLLERRKDP